MRTVHGFGYAFCGMVIADAPAASPDPSRGAFRLIRGTREVELLEGANVLGRSNDCAVWIDSETVSRRHAQILVSQGTAMLEDLGSKNGTYLGGTKIDGPSRLSDGDEVSVGSVVLTLRVFQGPESTRTGPAP